MELIINIYWKRSDSSGLPANTKKKNLNITQFVYCWYFSCKYFAFEFLLQSFWEGERLRLLDSELKEKDLDVERI